MQEKEMQELKSLRDIVTLSTQFTNIKDFDIMMEQMLRSARVFFNCDAGSIYIVEGDHLKFSYTQNDTLQSRLEPGQKLIYNYFTVPINENSLSGYVAKTGEVLIIDDAYELSDDLPFHIDKSFDKKADYRSTSMATIPLKLSNDEIIGVLQLINAKDGDGSITSFPEYTEKYGKYFAQSAADALERSKLMRTILLRMMSMAELRDPSETALHVNRVGGYAVELYETWARKKGIQIKDVDSTRDTLRMAAMLHDVGKVAISDTILKKPGKLTDDEYNTMKNHTILGARLFKSPMSDLENAAADVALNHHERWDGTGYPGHVDFVTGNAVDGQSDANGNPIPKEGEEIPLFGRIVALADVYDALSSPRCYKKAWEEDRVLEVIREERGKHFDPDLVDCFFECIDQIRAIKDRYS